MQYARRKKRENMVRGKFIGQSP